MGADASSEETKDVELAKNVEETKQGSFLTDHRVPVIVAVIGLVGSLLGTFYGGRVTAGAGPASIAASKPPASVSIENPSDGAHIQMALTITGKVSNLRPNESVVVYNETASAGTPSGTFYPGLGPSRSTRTGSGHARFTWGAPQTTATSSTFGLR